jgi:hypothetical protein
MGSGTQTTSHCKHKGYLLLLCGLVNNIKNDLHYWTLNDFVMCKGYATYGEGDNDDTVLGNTPVFD